MLSAEVWATLTSAPVLTLFGAIVAALSAFLVSLWQARPAIETAREAAIQSAYKIGDELRDELRGDLKDAKEYARAVELRFLEKLTALQQELAATKATLRTVERMRCDNPTCEVFKR